jgi:c-di-GMP-binding flagellar brake protein YcgR
MQHRWAARRHPRSPITVQILVDGYVVAHGEVADISLKGAGLRASEGLRPGETVELRLDTEADDLPSFFSRARIVWSRSAVGADDASRCGVRWSDLTEAEAGPLIRLIEASCTEH